MGQIANAYPQGGLILRMALSIPRRPPKLCQAAGPQATDLKRAVNPGGRAVDFFFQGLRQHGLVEREIDHEPLHSIIFFLQLPEPPRFAHPQMGVLLFPRVEGGVTHPELSAEVADGGPGVGLSDRVQESVPLRTSTASEVHSFRPGPPKPSVYSSYNLPSFSG